MTDHQWLRYTGYCAVSWTVWYLWWAMTHVCWNPPFLPGPVDADGDTETTVDGVKYVKINGKWYEKWQQH